MSDAKLRELERRFKESGRVEDEAAWLRERVRAGELDPERLALAAYVGHPGASRAVDDAAGPDDLGAWGEGLRRWGQRVWIRALLSALEHARLRSGTAEGRAWLTCPCQEHAEAWRAGLRDMAAPPARAPLLSACRAVADEADEGWTVEPSVRIGRSLSGAEARRAREALEAAGAVAKVKAEPDGSGSFVRLGAPGRNKIFVIKEVRSLTGFGLREAKELVERAGVTLEWVFQTCEAERPGVRLAVRRELLPWALNAE